MATPEEIIEQAMAEPQSATADGQSATAHSLTDLVKAASFLKGTQATANPLGPRSGWNLLRPARAIPPGPTD
jgi:hypothetical protein